MTAYMLDTNAFNHVLDDNIPVEAVRGLHLLATHVPWDELNATALKNPTRAAALLAVFEQIAPDIAVTEFGRLECQQLEPSKIYIRRWRF